MASDGKEQRIEMKPSKVDKDIRAIIEAINAAFPHIEGCEAQAHVLIQPQERVFAIVGPQHDNSPWGRGDTLEQAISDLKQKVRAEVAKIKARLETDKVLHASNSDIAIKKMTQAHLLLSNPKTVKTAKKSKKGK
jgi:hypothetical protein